MNARNHHYLSQCYLKGFTSGGSKNSKLVVFDLGEKKVFETIPRNVGALRDFNRINIQGVDPNILETSLGKVEDKAATALKKLREGARFEGELKTVILNLIALLAARSPQRREQLQKLEAQIAEKMMSMTLATKERWESQLNQMKDDGVQDNDKVTYEDMKKFHASKKYTIKVAREHHIEMEFVAVEAILPTLFDRKWVIVKSSKESGPIVTSDSPVHLVWKEPQKIPPFYRNSPGFGLKSTQVYFPLSQSNALVGEFEGQDGAATATREVVAKLNSNIIMFAKRQLFSPNQNFLFQDQSGRILEGKYLLQQITTSGA